MKKPEFFYRTTDTTLDEHALLDLCEEYGNQIGGVSSLFLGKRLKGNGITSLSQFMNCSVEDILQFEKVGPKKAKEFIKMQQYYKNKGEI